MVDYHSSRPGHDLRYALSGEKMKKLGWEPKPIRSRLEEVIRWTLKPEMAIICFFLNLILAALIGNVFRN